MILYLGSPSEASSIHPVDGYDKGVSCDGRITGRGTAIYAGSRIYAATANSGYRASDDLNRHTLLRIAYTDTGRTCPAFGMDDATLYGQRSITTDPCSSGSIVISFCPYGSQGTASS